MPIISRETIDSITKFIPQLEERVNEIAEKLSGRARETLEQDIVLEKIKRYVRDLWEVLRQRIITKTLPFTHKFLIILILLCWNATIASAETVQNFDINADTPFLEKNCVGSNPGAAPPQELPGGPTGTGNYLRLTTTSLPLPISNSITFDRTDPGLYSQIVAEFDFRMIPGNSRADGLGFALLNTAYYGNNGSICPTFLPYVPEEPNFTGSLGVGFDIYKNIDHVDYPDDSNNNHISIHFDGAHVKQFPFPVTSVDLAGSQWIHAKIIMRPGGGSSNVSVTLTPSGGQPVTVIDNFPVPGFNPYVGRVFFGARSGGESADHDLDNINVQFSGSPDPNVYGQWSNVIDAQIVPIHMHLLPTGKIMYWENGGFEVTLLDEIRLFDPVMGTISTPALPGHDIFCTGHSFLADGALFVTGGHDEEDLVGLPNASIYNPFTDSWTSLPNMNAGRWYPTNTTLANGDVLVLSGLDSNTNLNTLPQVWETANGTWRDLTNAQILMPLDGGLYPRMFLTPNGRVFRVDPTPYGKTWYLETSGLGSWSEGPPSKKGSTRDYGSAVMYEAGKIMITGGGEFPPTATTEVIDLNGSGPTWRFVAPMAFARRHLNATLLPDGKVLVIGGTSSPGFNEATDAVHVAEMWDPETEMWSIMSGMQAPRVYHSTAALLPDGRVLAGGGGRPAPGPTGHTDQPDFEIYSPPYLFNAASPMIDSAPTTVNYGETFFVETSNATNITNVNWIRLPSVTHAFDQNQWMNKLGFSQASGGLNVTAPVDSNLAPPGYYMLFIVNEDDVPSVAQIIHIPTMAMSYAQWVNEVDFAGQGADPSPTADPDNDGNTNGIEYVMALEPFSTSDVATTLSVNGSNLEFSFYRARNAANATYTVQSSTDLVTWTDQAVNPGTVGTMVTYLQTFQGLGDRLFLRLKVQLP